ncbi:ABC transporter ATP-binding protein [Calothrix sp. UHCC 0171]|uniref:ABC transporter ATP-binding protein n=1 Tax=Calothrix sp. UHCC 0171 TaxID=3110245 RepID=UPI002B215EE1|nr:ABC transporter ATP-binding protein [Calothrix sp. UHCC 0171]MEA5569988.1 ABC transporter ATP-binding protein [Calothrix sp. UHCC 0171]
MGEEIAISLKNVSKCFKRYNHPADRLQEILLPGKNRSEEFWALRDIELEIPRGETVGIVGRNGSGKSTLLQIIAGTLTPTTGEVKVNGRVSALLELGSGFNPEFTGRQNVFFNGRILGLSQKEIEDKFDEIASFADIGDFIDEPVKTYSSGMFVRLAFAVAINVDPEILIVDEALSVGDGVFVHRCMAKIKDFQDANGTILFVSHDLGSVNRLCSSCYWLNNSRIVEKGSPVDVSKSYQAWMYDRINEGIREKANNSQDLENNRNTKTSIDLIAGDKQTEKLKINSFTGNNFLAFPNTKRFGTGRCEILSLEMQNITGKKIGFIMPDETLIVSAKIISHDRVENPIFGIMMFDRLRVDIAGWNTSQYKYKLPAFEKGQIISVSFAITWPHIKSDTYSLEPAIADGSQENNEMLDWIQTPTALESGVTDLTFGFFRFTNVTVSHTVDILISPQELSNSLSK